MKTIIYTIGVLFISSACTQQQEYDATGIFEATTVTISAETYGKILSIPSEEGDSVAGGQFLALIDTTNLSLQKNQILTQQKAIRSSLPDISAQAAAIRSQITQAQTELRRQRNLLADGATTQKNYEDASARVNTLEAQLRGLLSTLNSNASSVIDNASSVLFQAQQIEEQINKCSIHSPLEGTILTKLAQEGEYAIPGKPLYKIANLNDIYLRSYFTVSQLANLKLGEKVTVIADFGNDLQYEYPGIITWISEESEFTPKSIQTKDSRANLVYAVKIKVKNDGRLKLGQYGEVRL